MKIKFLFLFFLLLSLTTISLAQSVIIKPKKVVYTRKGRKIEKERKTFNVTYPIISGALPADVKKRLENTISYWKTFETTLKENLGDEFWLTDLYYKVNYNKRGILDISLTQEGVGAYPDGQTVNLVVDLNTGKAVNFNDAFPLKNQNTLALLVDKKLQAEKAEIIKSIRDDKDETEESRQSLIETVAALEFTPENFKEFRVSDKGATILYDAGFPHVIQALQPDGEYFFSWAQLKPYIKRGGLLDKFVR